MEDLKQILLEHFQEPMDGYSWDDAVKSINEFYMKGQSNAEKIMRSPVRIRPTDLEPGQILKFDPGYHTEKPYYAQVIGMGFFIITTSIPGYKTLQISFDNWDYHSRRITIIGPPTPENLALLNNQVIE